MANKLIKGLTIQIGADTSALGKALRTAEEQMRGARSELKEINSALKSSGESAELWTQKQQVLTKVLDESKNRLNTLKTAQKSLADQLRDGDIDKSAYDKFKDKLTKAKDKLTELKKQQETIEAQFKSGEIDKDAYDRFQKKVDAAEKKVKDLETAEHSLEENLQLGNISEEQYRAFMREMEAAQSDVKYFSGELDSVNKKLADTGDTADDTGGDIKDLGDETQKSGEKAEEAADGGYSTLKNVIANLATEAITLAAKELKDFTADVITTGMTFDAQMSSVGAISGATADEIALLTDKAKEMGATTKFTSTQAGEALQYMAMAGWKTEDMLGGLDGIMNLAAASGEDLASTSDIVTDALTAFGLTAADSGHFADVLAAASSNANTNVKMMGETFKYAAPIAGALGFSIDDTALAIGLMANSGIKATQAGTALRTLLTNLSSDFTVTGAAIGDVSIKTQNADGTMRSLSDILTDTRTAFDGLTESEKANQAETLVGKNAMSGFLALMNAAPADVEKLTGAIADCDGAAASMSETMQDNLAGDVTLMESAIDGMKISLSEKLTPELRDIVQYTTAHMPEIETALGKVFTAGGKVVKGAVKYLPEIVDTAEDMMPVIVGIGAAFAAWNVATKISAAATAIGAFSTAVKSGDAVMKALNTTMNLNPAVAVTAAVVGLTAAVIAYSKASKDEEDTIDEINKKYAEQFEAIEKTRGSINSMKDDYNSRAADVKAESDRVTAMWEELDKLTDASGRVKDADKARAEYLLNELNNALGTEYSMTENQIWNYQQLAGEIDNVIAKKKAEAYLDEYLAQASGMAQAQADSLATYEQLYAAEEDAKSRKQEALERYEELSGNSADVISPLDYINSGDWNTGALEAAEDYLDISDEAGVLYAQKQEAWLNYQQAIMYNDKLKEAETALYEERYEDVEKILYASEDANKAILENAKDFNEDIRAAFNDSLTKSRADLEAAVKTGSQSASDEALDALVETLKLGQEAGAKGADLITAEIKDSIQSLLDGGFDISKLTTWAKNSGVTVGDVFGDDYERVVQEQLDKGFDIVPLLMWGKNSGLELGDVLGDNYYDVVQQLIDGGFDVSELLVWGAESGYATSDEFASLFKQNASTQLGEGFDTAGFMRWISSLGEDAGDIFGLNFQSAYTRYIYATNDLIPKNINSESDAFYRKIGAYAKGGTLREGEGIIAEAGPELLTIANGVATITPLSDKAKNITMTDTALSALSAMGVPFMASGGFIDHGSAVVAEIGPELLELMQGGVRVTPMSGSGQRSSAPSSAHTTIHQTYNIYVKEFASPQDARTTSQELARLQRSTDYGKGY